MITGRSARALLALAATACDAGAVVLGGRRGQRLAQARGAQRSGVTHAARIQPQQLRGAGWNVLGRCAEQIQVPRS